MSPTFTIGWVCALPIELAAVQVIMDEEYESPPWPPTDTNIYTFGRVGAHNVVAACLPAGKTGNNSAAVVASQMRNSFPELRFGLLVGIGGGVPSQKHDIRLGDVVISQPEYQHGGVVQFDFGKTVSGGGFTRTGSLNAPPTILLNALVNLGAKMDRGKLNVMEHLSAFATLEKFASPGSSQDVLYSASSKHVEGPTCASCKMEDIIVRRARKNTDPALFFGNIASGNQVMKDGPTRDRISRDLGGILCFEMEAAGLMNDFGCLVVRGICDYADAHKNKQWQPYAAAAAAACAKELLLLVPPVPSATRSSQIDHPTSTLPFTVSSLSDEQKDCLRSLAFPEQGSRGQEIHFAQNTCQWLSMDYQYWEWTKKASGLFWVKGSPGTGKSTLMKFAATAMSSKQPEDLVLSYFIHGRGTDLQKSPLGVFRALLNTMLASFPQTLSQLTKVFLDREARHGSYQEKRWSWAVQELRDCMLETLVKGAKDKAVIIFVDALDECGQHDAKALLSYFRDLMQQIEMEGRKVKICFSSRHYPILGADTIPAVFVERQNGEDIQLVVHERLKQIAPGNRRQQIEAQISSKSRGGFQWAVLVTEKIIEGDENGMKETNLLKMLTGIPETLYGLYGDILSTSNAAQKEQMIKLFHWILFARRPLSSQELREALATDKDTASATIDILRRHDSWVEDLTQFEKHVKHLSRGLVEFQDREIWEQHELNGEPWNREAQFIHQSVADYLVEKFLSSDDEDRTTTRSVAGAGHFEISRSCLRYVTMSDVQEGACLPRGSLSVRFPLAPYAVQFLFHHIREVEQEGIPQLDLLSLIQWNRQPESLQQLAHLWYILDPELSHAPKGWPFVGATPLHLLIAFGSKSALDAFLREEISYIDVKDSQGNTPLLLAIEEGHREMALTILKRSIEWSHRHNRAVDKSTGRHPGTDWQRRYDLDVNTTNESGDSAWSLVWTATTKDWELIRELPKAGSDANSSEKIELIAHAIRGTDRTLFMYLMEASSPPDGAVYFILQEMFSKARDETLEEFLSKLLAAGANTSRSRAFDRFCIANHTGGHYSGGNSIKDDDKDDEAILLASRRDQTSTVKLLLAHNISPTCSNKGGDTPLTIACLRGNIKLVNLLFSHNISPNYSKRDGNTPLSLACLGGHLELVKILLAKGAEPNISENDEKALRHLADSHGHLRVIELLLAIGANLSLPDNDGKTLLHSAVSNGDLGAIELLLANGVDLDVADNHGTTLLRSAVSSGHLEVMELLLTKGANPNFTDNKGKTTLHKAGAYGYTKIIELFLAKGADPDITDEYGKTPLFLASAYDNLEIVELLCAKGARLDIADIYGETPLITASATGNSEIVELLLAKGACRDSAANDGRTALGVALENGHTQVASLLRGT